jgi:hypothetical protein
MFPLRILPFWLIVVITRTAGIARIDPIYPTATIGYARIADFPAPKQAASLFPIGTPLRRHWKSLHQNGQLLNCPVQGCPRKGERGLTRHDNWRGHCRNSHGQASQNGPGWVTRFYSLVHALSFSYGLFYLNIKLSMSVSAHSKYVWFCLHPFTVLHPIQLPKPLFRVAFQAPSPF